MNPRRLSRSIACVALSVGLLLVSSPAPAASVVGPGMAPAAFAYPEGSLARAEIDRTLPETDILRRFDEAQGKDAGSRRAAQFEILRLVKADPQRLFRELRAERPVLDLPDLDLSLVTRARDTREILDNPTLFSVRDYRDRMEPVVGPYMLNRDSDPYANVEEKPWMRSLVLSSDFPRVRAIARSAAADGIRTGLRPDGTLEVVSAVGRAVPVQVVREYFGFQAPPERLRDWSFKTQDSFFHNVAYIRGARGFLIRRFGFGGREIQDSQIEALQVHEAAIAAGREMRAFLRDALDHQDGVVAQDTVFARMLRANPTLAFPKSDDRIVANVMGTLIGAVETTNAAIVQSLNQLLIRPEILSRARAAAARVGPDDPIEKSEFAGYVWEALRFHPINPFVVRYVEADAVIGTGDQARRLRKGTRVLVATHSAMLDPRSVRDPDTFIVDRPARDREMELGYGMHRCLGDVIAEVMVPEALRQLVLLPGLRRPDDASTIAVNQGIDFGTRGSFPERYTVHVVSR